MKLSFDNLFLTHNKIRHIIEINRFEYLVLLFHIPHNANLNKDNVNHDMEENETNWYDENEVLIGGDLLTELILPCIHQIQQVVINDLNRQIIIIQLLFLHPWWRLYDIGHIRIQIIQEALHPMLQGVLCDGSTLRVNLIRGENILNQRTKVIKKYRLILLIKLCCDINHCIDLFHLLQVAKNRCIQGIIVPLKVSILIMHCHHCNLHVRNVPEELIVTLIFIVRDTGLILWHEDVKCKWA